MSASEPQREPGQLEGLLLPEQNLALIGHAATFDSIDAQMREHRLPGAVLLHGPRGIGKATLAFAVARHILAYTGDEDAQRVEEQVAAGAHPNVFVLRPVMNKSGSRFNANILIGQISHRETSDAEPLVERLRRTRGRAGHRLCVVDSIDDCNVRSANALLKILEEPPADTTFILVSHRPGSLLPTIRSRCQSHAMRGLPDEHVRAVVAAQLPETPSDDLDRAVQLASGRPRRAFEALLLGSLDTLNTLQNWLSHPEAHPSAVHLGLADAIARSGGAEEAFARDLIMNALSEEAHAAALSGSRNRLASATELWDKARVSFADADAYNLDARQTLVSIFDALRQHSMRFADAVPAGSS